MKRRHFFSRVTVALAGLAASAFGGRPPVRPPVVSYMGNVTGKVAEGHGWKYYDRAEKDTPPFFVVYLPMVWSVTDMRQGRWDDTKRSLVKNIASCYEDALEDAEAWFRRNQ